MSSFSVIFTLFYIPDIIIVLEKSQDEVEVRINWVGQIGFNVEIKGQFG